MKQTKKVSVGPNPAFADNNPRNIGIVEQLQKGVTAPQQRGQQIPLTFSRPPHHLLNFMIRDFLPYQAHTGTNDNKQQ